MIWKTTMTLRRHTNSCTSQYSMNQRFISHCSAGIDGFGVGDGSCSLYNRPDFSQLKNRTQSMHTQNRYACFVLWFWGRHRFLHPYTSVALPTKEKNKFWRFHLKVNAHFHDEIKISVLQSTDARRIYIYQTVLRKICRDYNIAMLLFTYLQLFEISEFTEKQTQMTSKQL